MSNAGESGEAKRNLTGEVAPILSVRRGVTNRAHDVLSVTFSGEYLSDIKTLFDAMNNVESIEDVIAAGIEILIQSKGKTIAILDEEDRIVDEYRYLWKAK